MRPELQAKLLQHLNKKKADKGFTLVELLVVIVIIGILTAVALPNFLSQSAKAKQSEAKQNISAVNRAQQAYRTDNTVFATTFEQLALGTMTGTTGSTTTNYSYTLVSPGADSAAALATSRDTTLKSYSAGIGRYNNTENLPVVTSAQCENIATGTSPAAAPAIVTTSAGSVTCVAASTVKL